MAKQALLPVLAAALALALPLASAHGDGAEAAYDPLALDARLHAAPDVTLGEDKPPEGGAFFPAGEPNKPQPPLDFAWTVPGALVLSGEAVVTLAASAEKPMVTRDRDGRSFEVVLLRNGEPVPGASARVGATDPAGTAALQPSPLRFEAKLKLDALALAKGDVLALRVQPLMPLVPAEGLRVLVGGDAGTRLYVPSARVPTVKDLGLQDAPLEEFLLAAEPGLQGGSGVVHHALRVDHDKAEFVDGGASGTGRAFLVLRGAESSAAAHEHHETLDPARRAGAAHQFQVGDRLVRVHPGVGVKVPLAPGPDGLTVTITCVLHCPVGGFERVVSLATPDDPSGATGSTLIPPPRSTKGIPVSEDAPADEDQNLLPAPGSHAALLGMAAAWAIVRLRHRP